MARPSSLATASASAISPASQGLTSPRCRLNTPIMRSKTRIGVAMVERAPRARRVSGLPSEGSSRSSLGRRHVGNRHGAAVARREVHGRQVRRLVAHRLDARRVPFGEHGHRLPLLAEADEAPCDADRLRGLLDRHLQDRVQVELGTDTAADLRDQPLALERDAQGLGGASPAEGEGHLARQALDDVDLGVREMPVGRPGHHDEHAGDLTLGDERDERGALGGDGLGEPPVDVGRGRDVVHRQRLARVRDVHDRARVLVEVERDLGPPVLLQAARGETERAPGLLVDPGEQERVGLEQRLDLVEERLDRLFGGVRPRERGGEARDRVDFSLALGRPILGLAHAPARLEHKASIVPAEEHDQARNRHRDGPSDHQPGRLLLEDVLVGEREAPEEPCEGRNEREEKPDPDSEPRCPPLADERDAEQDGHQPVEHRENQQRHGVEHRFCFVAHGVWP